MSHMLTKISTFVISMTGLVVAIVTPHDYSCTHTSHTHNTHYMHTHNTHEHYSTHTTHMETTQQ